MAALDKVAAFFDISIDQLVHLDNDLPEEVRIEDKATAEQIKLIQQLDEDDKNVVFKMVDTFLTKKKMKDFFEKNVASH